MTRFQSAVIQILTIIAAIITQIFITDQNLRIVIVGALSALQAQLGLQAYNNNPDGTPAEIAYRKGKHEGKRDQRDHQRDKQNKIYRDLDK